MPRAGITVPGVSCPTPGEDNLRELRGAAAPGRKRHLARGARAVKGMSSTVVSNPGCQLPPSLALSGSAALSFYLLPVSVDLGDCPKLASASVLLWHSGSFPSVPSLIPVCLSFFASPPSCLAVYPSRGLLRTLASPKHQEPHARASPSHPPPRPPEVSHCFSQLRRI